MELLRHSLDRQGPARTCQALAMHVSVQQQTVASAAFACRLLVPGSAVMLTPLHSKRLCDVPLAQQLALGAGGLGAGGPNNGFLTMDQARSLLPLLPDDASVSVCWGGVWEGGGGGR